jgi:hypothetical protein
MFVQRIRTQHRDHATGWLLLCSQELPAYTAVEPCVYLQYTMRRTVSLDASEL